MLLPCLVLIGCRLQSPIATKADKRGEEEGKAAQEGEGEGEAKPEPAASGTWNPFWRNSQACCPALPCPALPCPALSCPALPCPALPCPALPCPANSVKSVNAVNSVTLVNAIDSETSPGVQSKEAAPQDPKQAPSQAGAAGSGSPSVDKARYSAGPSDQDILTSLPRDSIVDRMQHQASEGEPRQLRLLQQMLLKAGLRRCCPRRCCVRCNTCYWNLAVRRRCPRMCRDCCLTTGNHVSMLWRM